MRTSNRSDTPAASSTIWQLRLADTTAVRTPAAWSCSMNRQVVR